MSRYIGWTFSRVDGSIGFDATPEGEFRREMLPPCLLTKHAVAAPNLHAASVQMARIAGVVTPGINRHACA
jgi:hypothetical protein